MPTFPTFNKYADRGYQNNNNSNNNSASSNNNISNNNNDERVGGGGRKRHMEDDRSMKGKMNAKFGGDDYNKFNFRF